MTIASFKKVKLQDVAANAGIFVDGDWVESKDQDPCGDVRLTQLADIGVGEFLNRSSRFLTSEKAAELKCTFLEPGDILVARMPDPIGRACIFPGDKRPCVTVVDVCIIRPDPQQVDNRWLMWIINSPRFKHQLEQYLSGTTRQRISRKNLQKLELPLPPIEEQRRIAAILDKADGVRRKRKEAIALTEELLRSAFLDMFGDPVTNPKGWEIWSMKDVIEKISTGWSAGGEDEPLEEGEWGVLKISAVTTGQFIPTEFKNVGKPPFNKPTIVPKKGDLLFTRANTRELVAATCLVEKDCENLFLPDKIWSIETKKEVATREYLRFLLSEPKYRSLLTRKATGTSGSMLNVSQKKLLEMHAPIPSIELQREFSAFVWKNFALRDKYSSTIKHSEDEFNSLLQRAFRGEL